MSRGRVAARLMRDLEPDTASVALVLELLEERERLRQKLALLRSLVDDR